MSEITPGRARPERVRAERVRAERVRAEQVQTERPQAERNQTERGQVELPTVRTATQQVRSVGAGLPGALVGSGEIRVLPEPRPQRADWVVLWPFTHCLPLDSHYCCVHARGPEQVSGGDGRAPRPSPPGQGILLR